MQARLDWFGKHEKPFDAFLRYNGISVIGLTVAVLCAVALCALVIFESNFERFAPAAGRNVAQLGELGCVDTCLKGTHRKNFSCELVSYRGRRLIEILSPIAPTREAMRDERTDKDADKAGCSAAYAGIYVGLPLLLVAIISGICFISSEANWLHLRRRQKISDWQSRRYKRQSRRDQAAFEAYKLEREARIRAGAINEPWNPPHF